MIICCDKFQAHINKSNGEFKKHSNGTWDILMWWRHCIVKGMKHCPFCGLSMFDPPKK